VVDTNVSKVQSVAQGGHRIPFFAAPTYPLRYKRADLSKVPFLAVRGQARMGSSPGQWKTALEQRLKIFHAVLVNEVPRALAASQLPHSIDKIKASFTKAHEATTAVIRHHQWKAALRGGGGDDERLERIVRVHRESVSRELEAVLGVRPDEMLKPVFDSCADRAELCYRNALATVAEEKRARTAAAAAAAAAEATAVYHKQRAAFEQHQQQQQQR
ncbi:unnamed protein product, partial [Scytosiphon promiscuus]